MAATGIPVQGTPVTAVPQELYLDQTHQPTSRIKLFIKCRGLQNRDYLSKSDPLAVLYTRDGRGRWVEHGRTEWIKDKLDVDFTTTFSLQYYFECIQPLRFEVYDIDNPQTQSLADDDFLGAAECDIGQIAGSRGQTKKMDLRDRSLNADQRRGDIYVHLEEMKDHDQILNLQFSGKDLAKMDLFGKSDPYYKISYQIEGNEWHLAFKSEYIKQDLDPLWKPHEISMADLCLNDVNRQLRIEVWDWDRLTSDDEIGWFVTTAAELLAAGRREDGAPTSFTLIHTKDPKKKAGQLVVNKFELQPTFLDYLLGGCELDLAIAVDFTKSNGDPATPQSLHHLRTDGPNDYQAAMISVGSILMNYVSDPQYPLFGFGGRVHPGSEQYPEITSPDKVSHCFHLNGKRDCYCRGLPEVMEAYAQAIRSFLLWGPTNFASVIAASAQHAAAHAPGQRYSILLIITDGIISDMDDTIQQIVQASDLPLSIVIVGVGDANFQSMVDLDCDDGLLRDMRGRRASRDIVQFVPYNQFRSQPPMLAAQELTRLVGVTYYDLLAPLCRTGKWCTTFMRAQRSG
ncbi:hypothetical protein CYMTET_30900 [Cymbomonas tetramitiformis]|uniref:Uncharacterized protein n=1 Tax=Cymbomonas tetramitiformis TaxID=36881 RepID=A0AAE0FIF5_9CHLO|nr:hypothetical protein CYMTET_30900 [Cymbomonas tetramitiformis]